MIVNLFIIGNGFDRGHELNTTYWSFRIFVEDKDYEFLNSFEEKYSIYPSRVEDKDRTSRELLWNQLETNLANIDEDDIISNATSMDLGLEGGIMTYLTHSIIILNKNIDILTGWLSI